MCSMPKKGSRAQSRTLSLSHGKESSICGVCCQAVALGKDKALLYKGACKQLMHRFCASITEEQYQELTAKKVEFLCPTLCRVKQQLEIDNLSSEVAMLKLELAQLKEAVTVLSQKQKQAQTKVLARPFPKDTVPFGGSNVPFGSASKETMCPLASPQNQPIFNSYLNYLNLKTVWALSIELSEH